MLRDSICGGLERAIKELGWWKSEVTLAVVRTADSAHGDYSTNIALRLATRDKQEAGSDKQQAISNKRQEISKKQKGTIDNHELSQSPMTIAKKIADSFGDQPYLDKLEVKEPGFINIFIKSKFWQGEIEKVLKEGDKYGSNEVGKGKKANVEFVSANPTGPLHFGNARGGPIGDALASVLEFSGYSVIREYYNNNLGGQVEKLGESIKNVAAGGKLEDQEYKGEYIKDLAAEIGKVGNSAEVGQKAVGILLKDAIDDCADMGIKFDQVYSESEFIESGKTKIVVSELEKKGILKKKGGAVWFAPNDKFLEDRETVVVKSDGNYTYFANDIAYHELKFSEKPDLVVDVFGSNHHGHVPRLQAAISALGFDESKFYVILYQWVRFKRGGQLVKMSKRSGTFVTAREILDEVGSDAVRFMILSHDANSLIDFDLDLVREQSNKNPVYYVQYAHARICSILSKAERQRTKDEANYKLLTTNHELDLIKQIARLSEMVEDISKSFAVHQLTAYSKDLADSFHKFYENCKVIGEGKELFEARISLLLATRIALRNTLGLLGVSAPEKM